MRYLLDTNLCIEVIRGRRHDIIDRFRAHRHHSLCISAITYAELQYGCSKSSDPERHRHLLERFLLPCTVEDFPVSAGLWYGIVRSNLECRGCPIGPNDLLIAAHALASSSVLVTNNTREFARIPDLIVEDWATPSSA
ncbi:MAG: type II toxin-antitoxin system VapC family toxin [Planctomycetota bacterium]|nr:MAG: type II toxin-antitoxin system VapC family toxin [Planctomycetota bacterium]